MMRFLAVVVLLGAIVAFKLGFFLGLVVYAVLLCFLRNRIFHIFQMAGPRTSRQVPPTRIAHCQQLSAVELSQAYQRGDLSCVEVVRAYIHHIKRVNPYLNILVFECFDEALRAAKAADQVWAAWREDRTQPMPSWLLGVPCTVKESMECRGCPNTSGHPNRRGRISETDSPVVRNFREAGAIILGVTNTSELCMWYESSNHVYGITCNPYDTRRIVGGSSGGEGAAAGAVFATFGLGSDIGGSIRIPCVFNGVYGHKSSPHYISNEGQHPGAKHSANHYMSTGVITRFPEDLIPLNQIAARGGFGKDPALYPPAKPLERVIHLKSRKNLHVYAIEEFGAPWPVRVSESQKEAVRVAAETLRTHFGAKVTYVNFFDKKRCTGGEVVRELAPLAQTLDEWFTALGVDPEESKFNKCMAEGYSPGCVNWFVELFRWVLGKSQHTLPALILCVIEKIQDLLLRVRGTNDTSHQKAFQSFKEYLERLLGKDSILILPTFPTAAPRHHFPYWNPFQFQYTAAFNVLQLPATACLIWLGDEMKDRRTSFSYFEARAAHKSEDFHLPKGVQIVGATHQDELCISVAIALKKVLGGYRYPGWARLEEK